MRVPIAPAVGVFFTLHLLAHDPAIVSQAVTAAEQSRVPSSEVLSQWKAAYEAGVAANQQRRDEEALGFFERSWQLSAGDEQRGLAADRLGQTNRRLRHVNEARQWMERARQAFSKDPKFALRFAVATSSLSDLERATDDYRAAESLLREALGPQLCEPEARGLLRNNLGDLLREEGRNAEAAQLFTETLDARGMAPRLRAGAHIGLADVGRQQSDWEPSIGHWNEALEIARQAHDDAVEAIALRGLGETWLQSGNASRAEPLLRRSLKLMEASEEIPSEEIATAHSSLGELYRSQNKLALAQNEWSRALEIDQSVLGQSHPQVAVLMEMLSDVYSARGDFRIARDYSARAWQTMSGSFGEDSMAAATALTNQAVVEQRASNYNAAAKHYERAVDIARFHPDHRSLLSAIMVRYAALLKIMHRSREAKALLAERNSWRDTSISAFPVK